jgi:hypothetical protein
VRRWTAGTPTAAIDGERLGGRRVGEGEEAGDGREGVGGALMAKADGRGAGKAAPECGCRRPARGNGARPGEEEAPDRAGPPVGG